MISPGSKIAGLLGVILIALSFVIITSTTSYAQKRFIEATGKAYRGESDTENETIRRAFNEARLKAIQQIGEFIKTNEIKIDYDLRGKIGSEYISLTNIISGVTLKVVEDNVESFFDPEREAQYFVVKVKYAFDEKEFKKNIRDLINAAKDKNLDILHRLIKEYNERLLRLEQLLADGKVETSEYINLINEIHGYFEIISSEVEIQGKDVSDILDRKNEQYIELIDLYIDNLDYYFKNKYYFNRPIITKKEFIKQHSVKSKEKYIIRYEVAWKWDEQFKREILKIQEKMYRMIPDEYSDYLGRELKHIDHNYKDIRIDFDESSPVDFSVSLKRPFYKVCFSAKNEHGKRVKREVLKIGKSSEKISAKEEKSFTNDIDIKSSTHRNTEFFHVKYKRFLFYQRLISFQLSAKYAYISTDSTASFFVQDHNNAINYYGIGGIAYLNLNLVKPNVLMNAWRIRIGIEANLINTNGINNYDKKIFVSLSPSVALEFAKINKLKFSGFGIQYSPKFNNELTKDILNKPDLSYKSADEFYLYYIYKGFIFGIGYYYSGKNNLKGYATKVGYNIW